MKKYKIYLETTLFNYYLEPARDAHESVVQLFEEIREGKWEAYTSDYVVNELMEAPTQKPDKMLKLIHEFNLVTLEQHDDIRELAQRYIDFGIVPRSSVDDSRHLACAAYYGINLVISLNFAHIVRFKTKEMFAEFNKTYGINSPTIYSPREVINDV